MSVLTYKVMNLLPTSLRIDDLGVILQARGGNDGLCIINSDSHDRSVSLKELVRRKWVSVSPHTHTQPNIQKQQITAPQVSPVDVSMLQNEIRAMNSRFDEVLAALKTVPSSTHTVMNIPAPSGYSMHEQYRDGPISHSDDPIFIPSSIVPKEASVHISANEESSSVEGFDDSLAALRVARKKK